MKERTLKDDVLMHIRITGIDRGNVPLAAHYLVVATQIGRQGDRAYTDHPKLEGMAWLKAALADAKQEMTAAELTWLKSHQKAFAPLIEDYFAAYGWGEQDAETEPYPDGNTREQNMEMRSQRLLLHNVQRKSDGLRALPNIYVE